MLECKEYSALELRRMMHAGSNDSLKKKLKRYNIDYSWRGSGNKAFFQIYEIHDPFKVYCVFNLAFPYNSDFMKLCYFLHFFFERPDFSWKSMEMMEEELRRERFGMSRQTISKYLKHLEKLNYISRGSEFVYYKVYKRYGVQTHDIITKEEYLSAWRLYFEYREQHPEDNSRPAYSYMYSMFGGVPRKQAKYEENAITQKELEYLLSLVTDRISGDLSS